MPQDKSHREIFISALTESLQKNTFVKLSLGNYQGKETELKNVYVKPILIKRIPHLSFTYRYKTKDIVKNQLPADGLATIKDIISGDFKVATVFMHGAEMQFEVLQSGKQVIRTKQLNTEGKSASSHNNQKNRMINAEGQHYLHALQITDQAGAIYHSAQDKFKQINRFVEVIAPMLKDFNGDQIKKVADMGSGKGYLTFGLYDYLHNSLGWNSAVEGIEYRQDLVGLCNEIAAGSGFSELHFTQGTIESFDTAGTNMLIALHACDTATDDAIFKGITAHADLIIVAPCCHKQIRKEMKNSKAKNELSTLTRHGIFMERQAEMVTDSIRAMLLEYAGYKVKVFEFISDAHTPKNVLIVGTKAKVENQELKMEKLKKIEELKSFFGIGYHHLQRLMEM